MFGKKPHSDIKKSSQKVLDIKKDSISRLKHLRIVLENACATEAKVFFENNYTHIYYIFYDVFICVESNLKQRAHHRTHREELEFVRFVFEKLLILLPELVNRRWQCHSIQRIMKKFLHFGNTVKLRREGIRLFLLWYQILSENAPEELDKMFMSLVPGIIPTIPNPYLSIQNTSQNQVAYVKTSSIDTSQETSTFYASSTELAESGPVCSIEITPILQQISGEQVPDDTTRFYLDCLLEFMVSQVCKIEWKEKSEIRHLRSFNFLLEKFKKYYLPHLFPKISSTTNLFVPSLDLPLLHYESDNKCEYDNTRFTHKETLQLCQSAVVRWVTHFTQCLKKTNAIFQQYINNDLQDHNEANRPTASTESEVNQVNANHLTTTTTGMERDISTTSLGHDDVSYRDYKVVRDTLYSSRENINMVNEIFHQAFLMSFKYASTMRKVVAVYREWIHKNSTEKPPFLEEPVSSEAAVKEEKLVGDISDSAVESSATKETEAQDTSGNRLRKDSYLKAIHSDDNHLKAGFQNMLLVFLTNASNVFLLALSQDNLHMLDEQVDMCKRVLNIYRYMVMNVQMEKRVWEQLLMVLLRITSLVLKEVPPTRKEDTLGGRLAPALFQTLIVTWIKANLNVLISTSLWDKFSAVLSSLTQWEELIKEWAKTMETLTRVLAKQVYSIDLNDLPLERLSEQKMKKVRGIKKIIMGASDEKFGKVKSLHGNSVKSNYLSGSIFDENLVQSSGRIVSHMALHTSSGSVNHSSKHYALADVGMRRSMSDSTLFRKAFVYRGIKDNGLGTTSERKQVFVTGASPLIDDEYSRVISSFEDCAAPFLSKRIYLLQKSKSVDFLSHRAESPCFSESSECRSRSPSPTPSSGLENTSIKDSPMQIDVIVSSADNSCNNSEIGLSPSAEVCSVMSGGSTRGWLSDVAVVLWRRMLGSLGNINLITDPRIHFLVLKYLVDLSELLIKVRENLGVTLDNQSTPSPPELLPPLLNFVPWLFEALDLTDEYKQGKLMAYKLLCILMIRRHDIPIYKDYLVHFYHALHHSLMSNDQDIINTIVKACGPYLFSYGLPGCTLLIMDFIYAVENIVSSSETKGVPRTEAMSILGALLCLPNIYKEIPTLHASSSESFTTSCKDVKEHILNIIFKAGKREPAGLARCIAISSIGIYVYEELMKKTNQCHIKEAVTILLNAVRVNCKAVARVASDMLLLLSDHAEELSKNYSDLSKTVIEVLTSTLENLLPSSDAVLEKDDKKLILSLIHCIGEWCFIVNTSLPFTSDQDITQLLSVFKVLHAVATGKKDDIPQSASSLTELSSDLDPNIQIENFQEGTTPTSTAASKSVQSAEKAHSVDSSFFRALHHHDNNIILKLSARNLIFHLMNHLGHFPMGIGASRLTSLVNEYDDVPALIGDDLSSEVFHAPNIQFFVLNNCCIISFVEIPVLEIPSNIATTDFTTSKSQVRMIIRDLAGKFSWDCAIIYGPSDFYSDDSIEEAFTVSPVSMTTMHEISLNAREMSNALFSQSLRHRPKDVLPTAENSEDDLDNLDDLLQYIGHTSPECVLIPGHGLNMAPNLTSEDSKEKEIKIIDLLLKQKSDEHAQFQKYSTNKSMAAKSIKPPIPCEANSPFRHCRLLLNQLGYTSWDKRSKIDLLKKNEQLLRELRNLDKQVCRDTHKIAVIYVAEGQEDKNSILSNCGGSQEFEEFVAGLGWEVELENHLGFLGGLQRNKSTGNTAPYYSTSFTEVIFHVSTRMSNFMEEDAINKKVCHLGNDEVHIVWSEHTRDYRKEIIATEFCDVLIVIYPIGGRLYRIHISRKLGIPFFGPLFNGAIVEHKLLPGLVRATAINANRAKRSLISLYMNFYEERNKALETVAQNHKEKTTFEYFAASIYSPAPDLSSEADSCSTKDIPNLAAALLDARSKGSSYNSGIRSRTVSQSTADDMYSQATPQIFQDRPSTASHSEV